MSACNLQMRHARLTAASSSKQHGRLFCTCLQKSPGRSLSNLRSNTTAGHSATTQRRETLRVLSQRENTNGSQQQTQTVETTSNEPEGGRKRKGKSKKRQQEPVIIRRPQAQAQQQQAESSTSSSGGFAEWREGELLPRGWEKMNPVQKATELYAGKRGALFWANKVAWASLFIIGAAWILFRIVGPVTGLYTLKNDLLSPPNL